MTDKMTVEEELLLRRLRHLGFRFTPVPNSDGVLDQLTGHHLWSNGWIDAIQVHSSTNAKAVRLNPSEEVVWKLIDTFKVVVEAIIDLPSPGERSAPSLVLPGKMPTRLWLPGA